MVWYAESKDKRVRRESCWTLSNIAAGNHQHISALLKAGVLPKMFDLLETGSDKDVVKEATWVVGNCISGGSPTLKLRILDAGAIPPLCTVLSSFPHDTRILTNALEAITDLFQTVADHDPQRLQSCIESLQSCGGWEPIKNISVRKYCFGIIRKALHVD
jgi:importin subunit alpha-1